MDRRALIAVVISIVILVLYQEVVLRRLYPPRPPEEQTAEAPLQPTGQPTTPADQPLPELAAHAPAAQPAVSERLVEVDTDLYHATFTSRGARLTSFQLKQYRTAVQPDSPFQEIIVAGQGGELPFGVELRGPEQGLSDAGAPYAIDGANLTLTGAQEGSIDFAWQGDGVALRKHFAFRGDRYDFSATMSVLNHPPTYTSLEVSWAKTVTLGPLQAGSEVAFDRAVYLQGHKLTEDQFDKLTGGKVLTEEQGELAWIGYAGRHFFGAMVPVDAPNHRLWLKLRDHTVEQKVLSPLPAGGGDLKLDIYIGPKDFDTLETMGHNLSRVVNLGWFGFIAVPLLHGIKISHRFTGNYGLDIILLTVAIKILFLPLTQRSFQSMREMQKLQPQMAKIRERYKDNQEQMNKEMMELYRRHKVNPLGGCLPMVLQIPVFIGLYSALGNAVELRHAPFLLWINDLSAPDRLGTLQLPFVQHAGIPVLTLLMGVSMFVQQWMTPAAGDPAQQRVMMIMPLMFTFMFVNFPSGLALYWLVNNLLTIAQQSYMNRSKT